MKCTILTVVAAMAILAGCADDHRRSRYSWSDDDVFRRGNAVCDSDDNVCYKNGKANRGITRDVFGRKAARRGPFD
jgi:hypothetical protein